jgi:hypothetical protein
MNNFLWNMYSEKSNLNLPLPLLKIIYGDTQSYPLLPPSPQPPPYLCFNGLVCDIYINITKAISLSDI